MIIEWLFAAGIGILKAIFIIIPDLPPMPGFIVESLTYLTNMIFDGVGLLGFFIDLNFVKLLIPLLILVINFDRIYRFVMWIIRKLPLNIS